MTGTTPPVLDVTRLARDFAGARKRLLLLDYDGTLVPIERLPEMAKPSPQLLAMLKVLSADKHTTVFVISGRDRDFLQQHLGGLPLGMSVEHGNFVRKPSASASWTSPPAAGAVEWKTDVEAVFAAAVERVPGSFIERKEVNLAWHYRTAEEKEEAAVEAKAAEVVDLLRAQKLPIDVLWGKKNVEVRPSGVDKGTSVAALLDEYAAEGELFDFVLCLGDDKTDEDMFAALGAAKEQLPLVHSVVVGKKSSTASAHVATQADVDALLEALIGACHTSS